MAYAATSAINLSVFVSLVLIVVIVVVAWAGLVALILRGWRNRGRRQADLIGEMPTPPADLGEAQLGPHTGLYVGSTLAPRDGRWASIVAHLPVGAEAAHLCSVLTWDTRLARFLRISAVVAALAARHGVGTGDVVVGNGSATRTEKAPGHLDEWAAAFDDALRSSFAGIDAGLAAELWADTARLGDLPPLSEAEVLYDDAPFGVQYWVAVWTAS